MPNYTLYIVGTQYERTVYTLYVGGVTMWDKINKLLIAKNMNQETLAKKSGVTSGTISDLKYGRIKKPSFELACKIADALEVGLEELR